MATTKSTHPLIQINDEVREMTEEEFAEYETFKASIPALPQTTAE